MYLCNYTSSKSTREVRDGSSRKKSNLLFLLSNFVFFRNSTRRFDPIYFLTERRMATEIHKVSGSKNRQEAAAMDAPLIRLYFNCIQKP